ncbi:MAG: hypothetical protein KDB01_01190 [Planctomycetaceae bacterium]|nr:hypothetical protein [Planctomycetaceae bacterium]
MANQSNSLDTWALDREIVLSRVINAPRTKVFGFGAVEFGYQTLDKLAMHVQGQ